MSLLSQIVGSDASPHFHSLNVAQCCAAPQTVGMADSDDKNGGPNYLRAWRIKRKLTQEELARAVDTSTNMIQYLETGERGLSAKWLRRLSEPLKTTPGMLLETDPENVDMEVHDLFAHKMDREQRRQLRAIAQALVSTGTNGK